jgi:glycosyltransferase involved in cell wall biosynthesis
MRYLFDASELTPKSTKSIGIYRYAVGLAAAMATLLAEGEFMLIVCNGDNQADFSGLAQRPGVQLMPIQASMPGHVWRQWWQRLGCALFVRRQGVDLYFSPKGFIPRALGWSRRVKRVCVIHDLIPYWYFERYPKYFGALERLLVSDAFRNARAHADHIVAISNETRMQLLEWGVRPERVNIVHNGLDRVDAGAQDVQMPDVAGPFIFAMASTLPHKNLAGILAGYQAYRALAGDAAVPLLLCGATDIVQDGVVSLGRVSDAALRGLYQQASLFVFLSLIEGFGYPPLESLRVGTPVLCSNIEVFREVCGELASYVPPEQAQQVGRAMSELMVTPWTPARRAVLQEQARSRIAQRFDWALCGQGVLTSLRQCVAQKAEAGMAS